MEVDEQDGPSKGWTWVDAKPAAIASPEFGAHPEARMSARAPDFVPGNIGPVALPPEMADPTGQRKVVGPSVEKFMTEPLARPTGVDAIDSFLSPASLAMMAPSAVSAVKTAVSGLVENVGAPVTRKLITLVTPSFIKKPAEAIDLLNEIANAVRPKEAAPTAAVPAEAPNTAHLDRSVPVRASELTQAQLLERIKSGHGTAPSTVVEKPPIIAKPSAPVIETPAESVSPASPAVAPETTPAKPRMTAAEVAEASREVARQVERGISKDDAIDNVRRARELASMFGSPSAAAVSESVAERTARTVARNESNASIVGKIKELASSLKDKGYASPEAEAIKVISDGNAATFGKLMTLYMRSRSVKP